MALTLGQMQPLQGGGGGTAPGGQLQLGTAVGAAQPGAGLSQGLQGLAQNGSSGAYKPLIQALMKQRLNNTLAGRLPGTTPPSVGNGTGTSDLATGPQATAPQNLSLGGTPGAMLG